MRRKLVIFFGLLIVGAVWLYFQCIPPKDSTLIKQFYAHRDEFEKLRGMLQRDHNIRQVAAYGLSTTNRDEPDTLTPEQAGLQRSRYTEYLATFKNVDAILAVHNDGEYYFLIKRCGFAGGGWGIAVVSREIAPSNQIASLDDYQKTDHSSGGVYRHIEGDWYLWLK